MFVKKVKNKKGFSLVEVLVFSLIVVIVVLTFYRTFASGSSVLRDARARIAASQLANERIESLRNVAYGDIKTSEDGAIDNSYETTRNNVNFKVDTSIQYVDDSYDGLEGSGDLKSYDYKNIQVVVSWQVNGNTKSIKVYSHIAPPGTEELYDGGVLDISVRRSDTDAPVEGALVELRKVSDNTFIDQYTTGSDGRAYFPGEPVGNLNYKIIVRRDGFYGVDTMPHENGTTQVFEPFDLHASVVLSNITHKTIVLNPLGSLQLKTEDALGNDIPNIDFALEGGRLLGSHNTTNFYSFPKTNVHTDSSAKYTFSNQSGGRYFFGYLDTPNNSNYLFWKTQPLEDVTTNNNFGVSGGVVTDVKAILVPKDIPSLFLRITDNPTSPQLPTPLSGATVTVKNDTLTYSKEMVSDKFGKVYFPIDEDTVVPLQNVEYNVKVHVEGYQDKDTNITVNNLTEQDIALDTL